PLLGTDCFGFLAVTQALPPAPGSRTLTGPLPLDRRTRKREPRRAPSSVSWSRSELLPLAEEVLDVDRAVGDRDGDRRRARLRAEVADPRLGFRPGGRLGHRAAWHRDRVGAGAVGGRRGGPGGHDHTGQGLLGVGIRALEGGTGEGARPR